ncbi:MAG: VCBS repeat-containing protein, partial [Planctomycetia bacterium]|nr:VCBS repeat-containing protein [Planctomycetia bacterium]
MTSRRRLASWSLLVALAATSGFEPRDAEAVEFERIVIDNDFPGAYQVEVADVNGDRRPDVVTVGGGTCAWYENPSWKKRVVTGPKQTPGVISSATADLDGDGRAEIAIAYEFSMNEPTKGKLLLATPGKNPDDPWDVTQIAGVPSIHRLRWGKFPSDFAFDPSKARVSPPPAVKKQTALVVAPIFGPSAKPPVLDQEPAHVTLWFPGERPRSDRWLSARCGEAPVLHAIDVIDVNGYSGVYGASNLGVTDFTFVLTVSGAPTYLPHNLVAGAPGDSPKKGASEVHSGR